MAILVGTLAAGDSSLDQASYTANTVNPIDGFVTLVMVSNTHATATTQPAITGCGLTWSVVSTSDGGTQRVTLFSAVNSGSFTDDPVIDFGGATQTGVGYVFSEVRNSRLVGFLGTPVIATGTGTTASLTLSYNQSDDAGFCGLVFNVNTATLAAKSGWARQSQDLNHSAPVNCSGVIFRQTGDDTAPNATWTGSGNWRFIGVDILAPAVVPPPPPPVGGRRGGVVMRQRRRFWGLALPDRN